MWCSSDLAGTAQNASICAAKALQPIVGSVNTERRISCEGAIGGCHQTAEAHILKMYRAA
jgi:hypothetical protein